MPTTQLPSTSFATLAAQATRSASHWRAWAKRNSPDPINAKHAQQLAALCEQQAQILYTMQRNRTEWKPIRRADFTEPAA